jgi:hypothetical protein
MPARDACEVLTKAGFGSGCKEDAPKMMTARASAVFVFKLAQPRGESCQVLSFKGSGDYDDTVEAFAKMSMLAGAHRYGNANRLIFVQCNKDMPLENGRELEAAIAKL